MICNLVTLEDFERLQKETIEEMKKLLAAQEKAPKLIKSRDVCKMLGMSPGTLQNMRNSGEIEFIKFRNKISYEVKHVLNLIEKNKQNKGMSCLIYCVLIPYVDMDQLGL